MITSHTFPKMLFKAEFLEQSQICISLTTTWKEANFTSIAIQYINNKKTFRKVKIMCACQRTKSHDFFVFQETTSILGKHLLRFQQLSQLI